ncbi:sugar ABC transporter permease [Neobacillus niacini]|uniref:carbohydrate ABC transporter permease n=1 Tax=Neobacillus niacini TaxID=86668 RepID=UPI00052F58A7|nr:sugar ABC transporter permease [Neobacillus niacini]KGM45754.1 ABC transporter permease [Neobacillus niacini]MEC1523727.1 sugar ABC transporter permease [Neobacillus niacini]
MKNTVSSITTTATRATEKRKPRKKRTMKNEVWCWLFLAPTLLLFAMFQGWPIMASWYYAMLDWSGLTPDSTFVGMQNFINVAKDPYFWNAFKNSFKFMLGTVPFHLIIALVLAVILHRPGLKASNLFRTFIFLPVVTTTSIVGIIMVFIWGSDGAVNDSLFKLGILDQPINWLGDATWSMFTVILISVWKNLGVNLIYWLAGLQSIPKDLYEAADVDGASGTRKFFHITVPLLIPIGTIILLLNVVNSLKAFDLIKTMTNGGPFFATDVVSTYIYRYAFTSEMGLPQLGYASAAGLFFAVTIIIIAIIQSIVTKRMKGGNQ